MCENDYQQAVIETLTKGLCILNAIEENTRPEKKKLKKGNAEIKSRCSFDDIFFNEFDDACETLKASYEIVRRYGVLTVADLCDLCGLESSYTDSKYGWTSLDTVVIKHIENQYIICLPKATCVD